MADCCAVKDPALAPAVMNCPVSSSRSKQVANITVKSLVRHLPFELTPIQYYFCEAPECDVVYFPERPEAPTFYQADLLVPVKETSNSNPVCYCFGVTRGDIREEIQQTGKSTVIERIKAEVKAGRCACEMKNPSGKCCLGNVTRAVQEGLQARAADTGSAEDRHG